MKPLLKLFLCFWISLGQATEDHLVQEEGSPDLYDDLEIPKGPDMLGILQSAEELKVSGGANLKAGKGPYVGEECCNLSTTPTCLRKKGNCIPLNETCNGDVYYGKRYCLISNLKTCKCCAPTDCENGTLNPCKRLNGTCIEAHEKCDGRSVTGKEFCKNNKTCKCCFSNDCHCEPGTCTYNNGTGKCHRQQPNGTINVGMQECKDGCQCYIKECSNETGKGVPLSKVGNEYFYIHRTRLSWHTAKETCEKKGMVLAEPQDVLGLKQYLTDHNITTHLWLGGQGNNVTMAWVSSGAQVYPGPNTPEVWQTNHPSYITMSYCLDLRLPSVSAPLASYGCKYEHWFICECGQPTPISAIKNQDEIHING